MTAMLLLAACQIGLGSFASQLDDADAPLGADTGLEPLDTAVHDGNSAPVADAGPDLQVAVGEPADLDGTGSHDPDGDPLEAAWSLLDAPSGSAATILDADTLVATLIPDVEGTYTLELLVSDGALSASDTVEVEAVADDAPPVADAGSDIQVGVGSFVQLDGRGSYDPDGDPLAYTWSLRRPAGSSAVLSNTTSATPTFTADVAGTYEATLVVDDGQLASAPDTVRVTAVDAGSSSSGGGCSCSASPLPLAGRLLGVLAALASLVGIARLRRT